MQTKLWSTGYSEIPGLNEPKRTPHKPDHEWIRQQAMDSREGGTFRCPRCHHTFSVTYSVFAATGPFKQPEHHCKDCAEVLGLVSQ